MKKADIVFGLVVRTVGMERQAKELRTLMDLYVDAVWEDAEALNVAELPSQPPELAKSASVEGSVGELPPAEVAKPELQPRPAAERDREAGRRAYTGFLHLRCAACGEAKTFCAKRPTQTYHCTCGAALDLEGLVEAYTECECGKRSRYFTNCTEMWLEIPCVECGAHAMVEYREKENCYRSIWYE